MLRAATRAQPGELDRGHRAEVGLPRLGHQRPMRSGASVLRSS